MAACIKEPVIFGLPFMWLAGIDPKELRRGIAPLTGTALAAGWPFTLYYVARLSVADEFQHVAQRGTYFFDRAIDFDFSPHHLLQYLDAFWFHLELAFEGWKIAAVVCASALIALSLRRLPSLSLFGAGVFLLVFFAA